MAEIFFGITDTGRQRQNNEDVFIAEPVLKDAFLAAGVIDGVGGYEGGEVASALAKESILNYLKVPSGAIVSTLQEAMRSANQKILQQKATAGANEKMACVATLVLVEKGANKFYYAHVGDTRLYLFRDGSLIKITKDQSFVGFLEDSGRISETEALEHPKRNEINKALGFEVIDAQATDYIETGESPFLPGDLLLLCSDGLTDMVTKAEIIKVLSDTATLEQKARALIDAANTAGGKDNITVVLVKNDQKGIKDKKVKPVAKQQINQVIEPKNESKVPQKRKKSNNGLIYLLLVTTLVFLSAFLWQWFKKEKPSEAETVIVNNAFGKGEQQLRDSLQTTAGTLFLANTVYPDTIFITNPLVLEKDSVRIKGGGNTVLVGSDNALDSNQIKIAPNVKYVLLDSLSLLNMQIRTENRAILHFNKVRFINAGITQTSQYDDSILTSRLERVRTTDSLTKKAKR